MFQTNHIIEDESNVINLLIHIASSTSTTLTYFGVETASVILANIFQKTYSFIPYPDLLNEVCTKKYICVSGKKIYVADKKLFLVILLNSITKSNQFSKKKSTEIPECVIMYILDSLNVEKKYTVILLRTLTFILLKTKFMSPLLCKNIILEMQKVAMSPLSGIKRNVYEVSQVVLSFLNDTSKKQFCDIDLISLRSINTMDLMKLYPEEFLKDNKNCIVKKICFLFTNNLENKDGDLVYKRLISFYFFNEWKDEIWPIFLPYFQKIDISGYVCMKNIQY